MADFLKAHVSPFIDRKVRTGAKDRGDIANLMAPLAGHITVECKNTARISLGAWATETEAERVNDGAIAGVIAHKRHGKGAAGDQWITMTARDFVAIITGERP